MRLPVAIPVPLVATVAVTVPVTPIAVAFAFAVAAVAVAIICGRECRATLRNPMCACVHVRACVRARVRAWVRACARSEKGRSTPSRSRWRLFFLSLPSSSSLRSSPMLALTPR